MTPYLFEIKLTALGPDPDPPPCAVALEASDALDAVVELAGRELARRGFAVAACGRGVRGLPDE